MTVRSTAGIAHVIISALLLSRVSIPYASAEPVVPKTTHPPIIDVMPAYEAYVEQAKSLPGDTERVALFKRMVVDRFPEIAGAGVFPSGDDANFVSYLHQLARLDAPMHVVDARLRAELPEYRDAFRRALPDFTLSFPTCIVPSLMYNGAIATLNDDTPALMFGVPVLAEAGAAFPLRVLFSHEYFHLYHKQVNPGFDAEPRLLGRELWIEGLATYASSVIADDRDPVHLFYDPDLAKRYPGFTREVARVILERYDSTSKIDRMVYFRYGLSPSAEIPRRSGYAVGYLVAQRLGAHRSLSDLAVLRGVKLDRLIRDALGRIARDG
jgi:hypothetical protein